MCEITGEETFDQLKDKILSTTNTVLLENLIEKLKVRFFKNISIDVAELLRIIRSRIYELRIQLMEDKSDLSNNELKLDDCEKKLIDAEKNLSIEDLISFEMENKANQKQIEKLKEIKNGLADLGDKLVKLQNELNYLHKEQKRLQELIKSLNNGPSGPGVGNCRPKL